MSDDPREQAIRERLERLCPAPPWGYVYDGSSTWSVGAADDPQADQACSVRGRDHEAARARCQFLAHAPEDIAYLLSALASSRSREQALRAKLDGLMRWCDERRDAPTVTTLGMVQEQIVGILGEAPRAGEEEPS